MITFLILTGLVLATVAFQWWRNRRFDAEILAVIADLDAMDAIDVAMAETRNILDDEPAGLEPLDTDDRALIEVGGECWYLAGERVVLASGRVVTGAELAQLAPDLITARTVDSLYCADGYIPMPHDCDVEHGPTPDYTYEGIGVDVGEPTCGAARYRSKDTIWTCTEPMYHPLPHADSSDSPRVLWYDSDEATGWVSYGGTRVHRACLQARASIEIPPCLDCAPVLGIEVTR